MPERLSSGERRRKLTLVVEEQVADVLRAEVSSDEEGIHVLRFSTTNVPFRLEVFDVCELNAGIEVTEKLLLELNRVVKSGGELALIARGDMKHLENLLLKTGFSYMKGEVLNAARELRRYLANKTWRVYRGDLCPNCGGTKLLALIPSDSEVRKTWTLYCTSCSYTWYIDKPIRRI